jgi:hypothetical protein
MWYVQAPSLKVSSFPLALCTKRVRSARNKNHFHFDGARLSDIFYITRARLKVPNHTSNQLDLHPTSLLTRIKKPIEQELKATAQNNRNWIVRFGKSDGPFLSGLTIVRGAARLRWGSSPSTKRCLDGGEARTITTLKVGAVTTRSNWRK